MLKYSLGVDISARDFHVCLSVIDHQQKVVVVSTKRFNNTKPGFAELHSWIIKHRKKPDVPLVINMEATGVYHESCAYYLSAKGYTVSVVLPNKSKNYLRALGVKTKNDKADAQHLARMGAEQSLEIWQPMSMFYYELRELTRQHQSCQELKTVFKNQIHAKNHGVHQLKLVDKQLKKSIAMLDKQIKELEGAIEKHILKDADVSRKVKQICGIKGVGIQTVATVIAETNGFALIKNYRQLVSYTGYDVVENQSGTHVGKTKISKKGNSRIRRALFMPALSVVTHKQKPFVDLFNRTLERHNVKMKSYVAVQKKLLTTIYALWKTDAVFEENFVCKQNNNQKEIDEPGSTLAINNTTGQTERQKISPAKKDKAKQGSISKSYSSRSKVKKETRKGPEKKKE